MEKHPRVEELVYEESLRCRNNGFNVALCFKEVGIQDNNNEYSCIIALSIS
jgi:hypothetical protein